MLLSFLTQPGQAIGRRWLLTVLLLSTLPARSTPPPSAPLTIDSLHARLKRGGLPDSVRAYYLLTIGAHLMTTDLPDARRYTERGLALARRIDYPKGESMGLNNLAAMTYNAADYPAAQRAFERLLRVGRRSHDAETIGNAWLGLGNVAQALGNIPRALHHFEQARAAYATMRPPGPNGEILVLNNTANAYTLLHQPARAARALRQALALVKPATNANLRVGLYTGLAIYQSSAGYPDSARATLARGLALARKAQDLMGETTVHNMLGEIALGQNQPARAHTEVTQALALARRVGDPFAEEDALNLLASTLHALRRPEAFDTLRAYIALHDTLLAQDRTDAIIEAQTRFDVAGQRARIRALEQQRRIADLETRQRALQTSWLVGWLAALAVLIAVGLSWLYRRRQAQRELLLRNRLAADLHDDVGALLSQIALQSDLLHEGLTPLADQPAQWAEVAGSSRMAIRQLNDVVWNLDAHNDSVPDLLNRLRDYAHEVLPPSGRDVLFRADSPLPTASLPAPLRRNLYLIYKEALHNILKYAPAGCCVTVSLRATPTHLALTVANDAAVGALATDTHVRTSGHGLRNIRERAIAIGGTATAGPRPDGAGFEVHVSVPV